LVASPFFIDVLSIILCVLSVHNITAFHSKVPSVFTTSIDKYLLMYQGNDGKKSRQNKQFPHIPRPKK